MSVIQKWLTLAKECQPSLMLLLIWLMFNVAWSVGIWALTGSYFLGGILTIPMYALVVFNRAKGAIQIVSMFLLYSLLMGYLVFLVWYFIQLEPKFVTGIEYLFLGLMGSVIADYYAKCLVENNEPAC